MTTYEIATSPTPEVRRLMIKAKILSPSINRDIYLYELYNAALNAGKSKMEAYCYVSQKCFISEPNLRKIIRKMSQDL